ncbi:hypothetical protein [Novosphingobium sp.]|uniref:hypothetical protein n=1 Tax=Novosphingobium sp. TaxID=1874826 RepID=UPI001EB17CBF|nr:hypothetical protein [Novosphingobium sp.]MBK9011132.1 hypothetical protein [Novosphingobium sp.]
MPLAILLRHHPRWHRPVARATAVDVAGRGHGLPVALIAPVTYRRRRWASLARGRCGWCCWRWDPPSAPATEAHRACMLLLAAATSGAVFFRVYLALFAILGSMRHYELFYALDAWLAWGLPTAITAVVLKRAGDLRADPR